VLLNAALIAIQVLTSLVLILFILLHAGRGGGLSDMFGGGSMGGAMAGATVVERNLDRMTVVTALVWIFATIGLGLRL
jgi:preprotein translocase subunit SecG